jgi:hypothetical protein
MSVTRLPFPLDDFDDAGSGIAAAPNFLARPL